MELRTLIIACVAIGLVIFGAYALGIDIPNPLSKNVRFDIEMRPTCIAGILCSFTYGDVKVETTQLHGLLYFVPRKFAWICLGSPQQFVVELKVPEIGYAKTKTVGLCNNMAKVDFIVGFPRAGQYRWELTIYKATTNEVEWIDSGIVTVV